MARLKAKLTDVTPYHAKFWAHELTRRAPADSVDRLATALVDAQVDLNPHQVDAALFAFRSPLSKGVLLADEVGLGKTIEAGLVIAQKWAERKRRVLVITPSNLRKQWHQELEEKFFLRCAILESKPYNDDIKHGRFRPFERDAVVICSYQFARNKAADVHAVPWDLVVIDEAHRLRNVYKPGNIIANTLKQALAHAPKLLLTATPLQNSLLELFGLVTFLDEQVFGDLTSFREQFLQLGEDEVFRTLRARLKPVCQRTLRRQVTAYISYTRRLPLVEHFAPDESEDRLYNAVSDYLRRDNLLALPASQRSLMTLVLRKLLASSTFAIAGALQTLVTRLRKKVQRQQPAESLPEELEKDFEGLGEPEEEWQDEVQEPLLSDADRAALEREIADLEEFRQLAVSITHNAKGQALLKALRVGMAKAVELGAAEKAIIFTESRKTQDYLLRVLADSPWHGRVVLFNGSNTDEGSKAIYAAWKAKHDGNDRVTGSRTADMRSALVEYFRDQGQIMIATEAGAEGINLQFCSLVVNYDLPWNPQRIEQRIGRCHRYGQKHDVVVLNFLNSKNAADQRVFQLLSEKFRLFEGVFGASDEVLGAIESGVDLEKRIAVIYQECRKPEEIKSAFDQLQMELNFEIAETLNFARQQLLENFDDEVREKLKVRNEDSKASLDRYERMLLQLSEFELREHATFRDDGSFDLHRVPCEGDIPLGLYELPRRSGQAHYYRLTHPLAEAVVSAAKARPLDAADAVDVTFDLSAYKGKISAVEPMRGRVGWLRVTALAVESLDQAEDHLLVAAVDSDGAAIDPDAARRLFSLPATVGKNANVASGFSRTLFDSDAPALDRLTGAQQQHIQARISSKNGELFEAEADKLDGWADDLKLGLEREIKELDKQIKEARKGASIAVSLEAKLAAQKRMKAIESERNQKRRSLFDAQDAIDQKRGDLIAQIEGKLTQKVHSECLFTIRWRVV